MLWGRFPFKGSNTKDLYKTISRGLYTFPENSQIISNESKVFLMKLLAVNPNHRQCASQLLADSYLKNVKIKKEGSPGSEMFLSTNESSKFIS
jgi:serine/threonine protein kinase